MPKLTLTDALRNEYDLLFSRMEVRPERRLQIEKIYKRVVQPEARDNYREVEEKVGVPWFVIAVIHNLEASLRFDRHLHNGDPLSGPTTHVPKGRPSSEKRRYSWTESAVDALRQRKLDKRAKDEWTLADIAFVLEGYNGFGYRRNHPHVKSPYLWSFSNIYTRGKYIGDGTFSDDAVSQQCGGLSLLRHMMNANEEIARRVGSSAPVEDEDQDEDDTRVFPWSDAPEGEDVLTDEPLRQGPPFPAEYLINGMEDNESVALVQERLNSLGFDAGIVDGDFGDVTEAALMLFQARSADPSGEPLEIDGVVGPLTWEALFGPASAKGHEHGPEVLKTPSSMLSDAVRDIALGEIGARESPIGSNRGPRVDQYVRAVGLDPAGRHAWCMCFVYFCFEQAAKQIGIPNPCPRKAGVLAGWEACQKAANSGAKGITVVTAAEARKNPSKVRPGMVFFLSTGRGFGHTGIVTNNKNGVLETIEGNTNDNGSREGIGVFRRTGRKIQNVNVGYVSFF